MSGMRFKSIDDLPPSMRAQVQQQMDSVFGKAPVHGDRTVMLLPRQHGKSTMQAASAEIEQQAKRSKYGNKVTRVDGIRFDSKREADYYQQLKLRKAAGEVSYWLRQVPLHQPGGTRYVVDFLVFFTGDRAPEYVDAKGHETPIFRLKRREIEHHYPIKLVIV